MTEFSNIDEIHLPGMTETEFSANLDDVMERVSLTTEDMVIERDGQPVMVLVHPENYRRLHALSAQQEAEVPEHFKQWYDWIDVPAANTVQSIFLRKGSTVPLCSF